MPINHLVNECAPEGWLDQAGAAVAEQRKCRYGADGAVLRGIFPRHPEDRAELVRDPKYPSDVVIREVARKLANLFCGE